MYDRTGRPQCPHNAIPDNRCTRVRTVVVARPGLGTLNHAWLTVEALVARFGEKES